jgi:predicted DNA-binding transcriptional regulator YafY
LRRAIRELRRVNMVYHSASAPEPGTRKLDPYALAFRWGWWYVVGYCHTRGELRTFRVDRIRELNLLEDVFQMPVDFNAREFMQSDLQNQPQVRAKLKFSKEAANSALINRPYWDLLEEQPDGTVIVAFSSPDLNWAIGSILMYGPTVEVLEPVELRCLVRDSARATAAQYET